MGFPNQQLCVQAKTNPVILIFHMNITEKLAFFLCSRQVSTMEKYSMGFWSRINKYFCQDTKLIFGIESIFNALFSFSVFKS